MNLLSKNLRMKHKKIISNDSYKKSSTEHQLIEHINNDPLMFVEKSINLISKKIHIATSTLTRAIRRIGFKNYKFFLNFLIEKISEYKKN